MDAQGIRAYPRHLFVESHSIVDEYGPILSI